jgi:hypothetical protein
VYQVKVDRIELLDIINENRQKHIEAVEEALDGYHAKLKELLLDELDHIEAKAPLHLENIVNLPVPRNYVKQYDTVIAMLEMSVDAQLEISHEDFKSYVMDDWGWKENFSTVYTTYTSKKL